jgi:hypothetical protein
MNGSASTKSLMASLRTSLLSAVKPRTRYGNGRGDMIKIREKGKYGNIGIYSSMHSSLFKFRNMLLTLFTRPMRLGRA